MLLEAYRTDYQPEPGNRSYPVGFGSPGSGFCVSACGDTHSRHRSRPLLLLVVPDQPDETQKETWCTISLALQTRNSNQHEKS